MLCLHCDPEEPDGAQHAKYKRGPHLHLSMVGGDVKHAHVALAHGFLENILRSPEAITSAFSGAIEMIADELLDVL